MVELKFAISEHQKFVLTATGFLDDVSLPIVM